WLYADLLQNGVQSPIGDRQRIDERFGNGLDREGDVHIAGGVNIPVDGRQRQPPQLTIHRREFGNIIGRESRRFGGALIVHLGQIVGNGRQHAALLTRVASDYTRLSVQ